MAIRGGTITVKVAATDNVAVARVELWIGGLLRATTTRAPYELTFDTKLLADGSYVMFAKAFDTSGNATQSNSQTLDVVNSDKTAPLVSIVNPAPNATVSGTIPVSISASDNTRVQRVELYVEGVIKRSVMNPPYVTYLYTPDLADGPKVLQARAYDDAGNIGTSASVTVNFANNITNPGTGGEGGTGAALPFLRGVNRAGAEYGNYWTSSVNGWKANNGFYWQTDASVDAECAFIKGYGMNCIRLPFSWERIQHDLNGALDSTYSANLVRVVNRQVANGMYVILDMHGYARYATGAFNAQGVEQTNFTQRVMGDGNLTFAHLNDAWVKICSLFDTGNSKLIFNLMNEPHDMSGYTTDQWFDGVNTTIAAIRTAGYKQLILAPNTRGSDIGHWNFKTPGLNGNGTDAVSALKLVDSANNMAIDCHCYRDSGMYSSLPNWSGNGNATDNIISWARTNNRKLFFSEIGVNETATNAKTDYQAFLQKLNDAPDVVLGWTPWNLPSDLVSQIYTYSSPVNSTQFTATTSMSWVAPYLSSTVTVPGGTGGTGGGGNGGGTVTNSYPTSPASNYITNKQFTMKASDDVDSYYVVPSSYDASHNVPIGLFVWLHGCRGKSQYDSAYFSPSFNGFSKPNNLPANVSQTWITLAVGGREYVAGSEQGCWKQGTDESKITNAIAYVRTKFNIDPKRIFIGGYSSGGDIGYPYLFNNSTVFAGGVFCNTAPNGTAYTSSANKTRIYHLLHNSDDTYDLTGTNNKLDALATAGWTVTRDALAGGHYDSIGGDGDPSIPPTQTNPRSTNRDIYQYLLPKLNLSTWKLP